MKSINPANGETVGEYADHDAGDVERRLAAAKTAFSGWSRAPFSDRTRPMKRLGALLRERKPVLAALMAREMGKPVSQGASEVEKCASATDFFAEHAERFLAAEAIATEAKKTYVAYRPLGVVLGIMPWNFPLWQVIRASAPALMAGNAMLVKHAPNTPGSALALAALFHDAGFPDGLFDVLFVEEARVAPIIDDRRIAGVTLTGSTRAGRAVAARAGQALKRCVLELGGSDPYVVLADANLEDAANIAVTARLVNGGQSCIAGKRFIVVAPLRAAFEAAVTERMSRAIVGDPFDPKTEVGPMARVDLRDALHDQVVRSVKTGAKLVLGGEVSKRPGAWYPPTVLTGVRPGMPAFDEELFGPVLAVVPARDESDAVELANASTYGLGAAVLTGDAEKGERIARESLEAGSCFVNAQVRSDPRVPFGGIKDSGYGRELGAVGIKEFVNVKTIWVA
jgi:succinate-semialdehyde dehydrogenase/glutarate-semialdehyde dehydrogenase